VTEDGDELDEGEDELVAGECTFFIALVGVTNPCINVDCRRGLERC
jgi:hypothetical protein